MSRVPAEQRREQLIEATIRLAIREGLAQASVRNIAEEANVSLGVVHYCFNSKEALLNAVAQSFATPVLGPVSEAVMDAENAGPTASLSGAFDAFTSVMQADPNRQLLGYELAAWSIRGDGEAAKSLHASYLDLIEKLIVDGMGVAPEEGLPTGVLARMVLAILDGAMYGWLIDRNDEQTKLVLEAFVRALVAVVTEAPAEAST